MHFIFSLGFLVSMACDGGESGHWRFTSCTWSLQECAYSCPTRGARKVEEDSEKCPEWEPQLACYCWDESGAPPTEAE